VKLKIYRNDKMILLNLKHNNANLSHFYIF